MVKRQLTPAALEALVKQVPVWTHTRFGYAGAVQSDGKDTGIEVEVEVSYYNEFSITARTERWGELGFCHSKAYEGIFEQARDSKPLYSSRDEALEYAAGMLEKEEIRGN